VKTELGGHALDADSGGTAESSKHCENRSSEDCMDPDTGLEMVAQSESESE
jgi:hypothetical protein